METSRTISKQYLYGLKGWLLFFWTLLLVRVINIVFFEGLGKAILYLLHFKNLFQVSLTSFLILSVRLLELAFISYVMLLMSRLDYRTILLAKVLTVALCVRLFFFAFDFGWWSSDGLFVLIVESVLIALPIPLVIFLYIIKSKRVRNTFMFKAPKLPDRIQCPYCLAGLALEDEERILKEVTCPECNRTIDEAAFAA